MPEGEEREQETENLLEKIMMENFPNLVNEIDLQVQEAQRVPNKMNPKKLTPRHIIIKMTTIKDKENLKNSKKKQLVTYKGATINLLADLSTETLQARRDWQGIFKVMKSRGLQPSYSTQQSSHLESKGS